MDIAIVMPVYIATEELKQLTQNAARSLTADPRVYLIIVDDGSPMNTDFLKDIGHKVFTMKKNSGFGPACNKGLSWALKKFTYIGCANNDIEVYDGWLDALLEPYEKYDEVGITGI